MAILLRILIVLIEKSLESNFVFKSWLLQIPMIQWIILYRIMNKNKKSKFKPGPSRVVNITFRGKGELVYV